MFLKIIFSISFLFISLNIYSANFFLYLNIENKGDISSQFKINKITFYNNDFKKLNFKINKKINSNIIFNQIFIKKFTLPSANYIKIVLKTNNEELQIPVNLKITGNSIKCGFLYWNVKGSFSNGKFHPQLYFRNQEIPLRGELLFATSPEENAIYIIRTDKNQVCSAISINGIPTELALSCLNDKVFVLSSNAPSVKSIEVSTMRITDSFILAYVIKPSLMALGEGSIAIADSEYNKLTLINSENGEVYNTVKIGMGIKDIVFFPEKKRFYLASYRDQTIYVLSDTLSRIKTINMDCSPNALYIRDNFLYISENQCNIVTKYNLLTENIDSTLTIFSPGKIIAVDTTLFISSFLKKSLEIFYNNQTTSSNKISLTLKPFNMTICQRRGWLYVSSAEDEYLEVIDILKEKLAGKIPVGAKIYDIKVGNSSQSCK